MNLRVLATDLDGTLIPLDDNLQNQSDLESLQRYLDERSMELLFVTGRHYESVRDAIAQHRLPQPDWMICDVGTTIMHGTNSITMEVVRAYHEDLAIITAALGVDELADRLSTLEGIRKQEAVKQGPFKLSYYADAARLDAIAAAIKETLHEISAPYGIIASVDPFNGDGLIDMLPIGVSKASALNWWSRHMDVAPESILFAGDSGNDLAALTAGYRAIVVKNASVEVKSLAQQAHAEAGWTDRLFIATEQATSGVLEGTKHYCFQK